MGKFPARQQMMRIMPLQSAHKLYHLHASYFLIEPKTRTPRKFTGLGLGLMEIYRKLLEN